MKRLRRLPWFAIPLGAAALVAGAGLIYAQLDGADRGIPPVDSTSNFEVMGVEVDVTARSGEEARVEGWRRAQREGWKMLWARTTGRPVAQAPNLTGGLGLSWRRYAVVRDLHESDTHIASHALNGAPLELGAFGTSAISGNGRTIAFANGQVYAEPTP